LLAYAKKKEMSLIAFCMGEKGKVSRLMAPLLGSPWTYASPAADQATAPGQMTIREMKKLYRVIA
ncbi:MAG TPA: type I 3-dehydroquinate dehydratase, partial [Thermodesulfobacteriota bacterium]|nr:type I 3-dehydroquinate dehydratase [Thermodesulfobacteriota bacterium]